MTSSDSSTYGVDCRCSTTLDAIIGELDILYAKHSLEHKWVQPYHGLLRCFIGVAASPRHCVLDIDASMKIVICDYGESTPVYVFDPADPNYFKKVEAGIVSMMPRG